MGQPTANALQVESGTTTVLLGLRQGDSGSILVSGGIDGQVRMWRPDLSRIAVDISSGHGGVHAIVAPPDPTPAWFATAGDDGTIRVWDSATGAQLYELVGQGRAITGMVVVLNAGSDDVWLASASTDFTIRIWDVKTRAHIRTISTPFYDGSRLVAIRQPDGASLLATTSYSGSVTVWDTVSGEQVHELHGHLDWVSPLATLPHADGDWLVSGGEDGLVIVWDPVTGHRLHTLENHEGSVRALAALRSPEGRPLLASGGTDHVLRIWDVLSQSPVHVLAGHTDWVWALAPLPRSDGSAFLASASDDSTIRVWNPDTGFEIHRLNGH